MGEIYKASETGDTQAVLKAVKRGANINEPGFWNNSPLHIAIWEDHIETASVLIKLGADVHIKNDDGVTPLHWASYKGNPKLIAALLNKNTNINDVDNFGRTAVHWAAKKNDARMIKFLVGRGADLLIKDKYGVSAGKAAGYDIIARKCPEKMLPLIVDDWRAVGYLENPDKKHLSIAAAGAYKEGKYSEYLRIINNQA